MMKIAFPSPLVAGVTIACSSLVAPDARSQGLVFRVQQLHVDNNEACAVADYNNDGKLDVSAGEYWYAGPDFAQRKLRDLGTFGADYMTNNGEFARDVDGDGWVDVVAGDFKGTAVHWYRNPGADAHDKGENWEQRELIETELTQNEMAFFHDINGDGEVEYVPNSWNPKNPFMAYEFVGEKLEARVIGEATTISNGHGAGFGDIDGDGREDVVYMNGWYAQPEGGAFSAAWEQHPDFTLPHASCPILVADLNGDGRNDIIWGDGHNYGLYWEEQQTPDPDGTTNWRQHLIDKKFSQAHALAWGDLDGDGTDELITGKRVRAHSGKDPGAEDVSEIIRYSWNAETGSFEKQVIHQGEVGTGLQIRVADMDEDGDLDLVMAGKSGTHVLFNDGWAKE